MLNTLQLLQLLHDRTQAKTQLQYEMKVLTMDEAQIYFHVIIFMVKWGK